MAQKVQITLVDDLDGSPADETVSFSLDGSAYEIDLSAAHAAALRDALAGYVGAARRVGGRRVAGAKRASRGSSDTAEIRAWAKAHGHQVSERGRVSAAVRSAYEQAH
jgi:hypothetical protein